MTLAELGPVATISLLACLLTIAWCIRVVRRTYNRRKRILAALLGAAGVYQGFRVLVGKGVLVLPAMSEFEDAGNLVMTLLCVVCLFLIHHHNREENCTHMRLRLAEANGAQPAVQKASGPALPDNSLATAR